MSAASRTPSRIGIRTFASTATPYSGSRCVTGGAWAGTAPQRAPNDAQEGQPPGSSNRGGRHGSGLARAGGLDPFDGSRLSPARTGMQHPGQPDRRHHRPRGGGALQMPRRGSKPGPATGPDSATGARHACDPRPGDPRPPRRHRVPVRRHAGPAAGGRVPPDPGDDDPRRLRQRRARRRGDRRDPPRRGPGGGRPDRGRLPLPGVPRPGRSSTTTSRAGG